MTTAIYKQQKRGGPNMIPGMNEGPMTTAPRVNLNESQSYPERNGRGLTTSYPMNQWPKK